MIRVLDLIFALSIIKLPNEIKGFGKKSKGDHAMKEINIGQATALTSPDPLI